MYVHHIPTDISEGVFRYIRKLNETNIYHYQLKVCMTISMEIHPPQEERLSSVCLFENLGKGGLGDIINSEDGMKLVAHVSIMEKFAVDMKKYLLPEASVNNDLGIICSWLNSHRFRLNIAKAKAMVISRKRVAPRPVAELNGETLEHVDQFRLLGVIITPDLSWATHIISVILKTRLSISHIQRWQSEHTRHPVQSYCCTPLGLLLLHLGPSS